MSDRSDWIPVCLSAKGLANVLFSNWEHDFTFIVGDREYRCPSFIAEFLSPRVCTLRRDDCTVHSYRIQAPDPNEYFEDFLSFGFGSSQSLDSSQYPHFAAFSKELENGELFAALLRSFGPDLSESNVLAFCKELDLLGCSWDCELEFAAEHFLSFNESDLAELTDGQIRRIISHGSLRIESEDSLYNIIRGLIEKDLCFCSLLDEIRFENVSETSMRDFFELISHSFDLLTISVWGRLQGRLVPNAPICEDRRIYHRICRFREGCPFDGVISYLTKKHGGDLVRREIIAATSSTVHQQTFVAANALDLSGKSLMATENVANSWLCYDFKGLAIEPTHYSIRSRYNHDANHPRHWTLEESMDGEQWAELAREENRDELVGISRSFTFSTQSKSFVQMVRLRQTGKESSGANFLVLSCFELFGTLRGPNA
jgi:hypothetical protein